MGGVYFENVSKTFTTEAGGKVEALKNVSFNVRKDEFVSLLGPSGSGKSTLLRMALGLTNTSDGYITIDDRVIKSTSENVGMVFQEYSLMPWLNVIDNIVFGLEVRKVNKKDRYAIGREILENFGLKDFEKSFPYELSGGMQQRVAIARTIASSPEYIFMDEPFGALDAFTRIKMQNDLIELWEKENKTILFVTHSVEEAVFLSNRIIILSPRPGKIHKIYENNMEYPRDRYSNEFQSLSRKIMAEMMKLDGVGI